MQSQKLIHFELSNEFDPSIPVILSHEKIYSIQVGEKLFRLSGASLSSDAPSYFTKFFIQNENSEKVLFIDRSPEVFSKICNHLQGYLVEFEDENEFIKVWVDSYYFGLKKLQKILVEGDIYVSIGGKLFRISRTVFHATGNFPNFFTFSYDTLLTDKVRLIEKNIIRPPPQKPTMVPHKSPELFQELLEIMVGNNKHLGDYEHRNLLVKECRYYRFRELEQRIINHEIIINPFASNNQEILISLFDLLKSGIFNPSACKMVELPLEYKRPHLANEPKRTLIFQMDAGDPSINSDGSEITLILNKTIKLAIVKITKKYSLKFFNVFQDVSDEFQVEGIDGDLPSIISYVGLRNADVTINGLKMDKNWVTDFFGGTNLIELQIPEDSIDNITKQETKKRKIEVEDVKGDIMEIKLTKTSWKVMMRQNLGRLHAIRIEGYTDPHLFMKMKSFSL